MKVITSISIMKVITSISMVIVLISLVEYTNALSKSNVWKPTSKKNKKNARKRQLKETRNLKKIGKKNKAPTTKKKKEKKTKAPTTKKKKKKTKSPKETKSPTTMPSMSPSVGTSCVDNTEEFYIESAHWLNDKWKTCNWVQNRDNPGKTCGNLPEVASNCPVTCGKCDIDSPEIISTLQFRLILYHFHPYFRHYSYRRHYNLQMQMLADLRL